ncbi:hypothetical protein D4L85_33960 [Chryseolinea soli]|uniref:Uncharacterized protein n=1 Tax=Chryseolinea soli TaxID=2321403 RepID=A0A385SXC6_9BACT|nr:hypothetical protein D4L85_33960 [Chryseolinea soli]
MQVYWFSVNLFQDKTTRKCERGAVSIVALTPGFSLGLYIVVITCVRRLGIKPGVIKKIGCPFLRQPILFA